MNKIRYKIARKTAHIVFVEIMSFYIKIRKLKELKV